MSNYITTDIVFRVVEDACLLHEQKILKQLENLVSKKVLVLQKGNATIYRDNATGAIHYGHEVEIRIAEQDYIELLEKQNAQLIELLRKKDSDSCKK